ncbi:MAG: DNA translocase FtsK 4TM domain-containing protein, partial [Pirellulales bacterium]|nr:DNA translocase FtsK 4TM domain-containing protein [Pirellulales bacterium]
MSSITIDEEGEANVRQPNLIRDVVAVGLAALTLILTVSIVTRDAADPLDIPIWPISRFYAPDNVVYPTNDSITNACGYWGALVSAALFDTLGFATALVVAAAGGVATALLIRGQVNAPVLRSLGGTIMVIGVATAAGLVEIPIDGMPVVGNGGRLGAMTSTWLLQHFAPGGAWILTMTTLAVGTLLTTDYALLYAGKAIVSGSAKVSKSGMQKAADAMPITVRRKRKPYTDLEEPITIDGDESEEALLEEEAEE